MDIRRLACDARPAAAMPAGGCACCAAAGVDRRRAVALFAGAALAAAAPALPIVAQTDASAFRLCMEARNANPNEKLVPLLEYARDGVRLAFTLEKKLLIEFFDTDFPIDISLNSEDAAYDPDLKKVIFGDMYIARYEDSNLKLAAILAHEFGHAYQVRTDLIRLLKDIKSFHVKFVEIHSDYMAGAYSAWRDRRWKDGVKTNRIMGEVFFRLGDFNVLSPNHHGPGYERWIAFQRGYSDFEDYAWGAGKAPTNIVALSGVRYVQSTYF